MKKLKRISLNDLSQAEMLKKEMNMLKGGAGISKDPTTMYITCGCLDDECNTCYWERGPYEDESMEVLKNTTSATNSMVNKQSTLIYGMKDL